MDFNSYGTRRGNHEVMVRGTFANVRLRNQLAPGTEGGITVHLPDGDQTTIFEASERYADRGRPARGAGRQGVRVGVVTRLGGQGDPAPGGPCRAGGVVRADPPLQPDRHGRTAPAVPRRARTPRPWASPAHEVFSITGLGPLNDGVSPKTVKVTATAGDRRTNSRPGSGSTPRWRRSTTATGGSCPTCSARWPAEPPSDRAGPGCWSRVWVSPGRRASSSDRVHDRHPRILGRRRPSVGDPDGRHAGAEGAFDVPLPAVSDHDGTVRPGAQAVEDQREHGGVGLADPHLAGDHLPCRRRPPVRPASSLSRCRSEGPLVSSPTG